MSDPTKEPRNGNKLTEIFKDVKFPPSSKAQIDEKYEKIQKENYKARSQKVLSKIEFLNPDAVGRLIGRANEAQVIVNGKVVEALLDTGAQIGNISERLCEDLGLEILPVGPMLELEGTGGISIPYKGIVNVSLKVPGVESFQEEVPLLVLETTEYQEKVPVALGTSVLDLVVKAMTIEETEEATLSMKCVLKATMLSAGLRSVLASTPVKLDQFQGLLKVTKRIVIPPFETVAVSALSKIKGHTHKVHVVTEASV